MLGRPVDVPENNTLLRGFQFLCPDSVPSGRFCWNNECGHCELSFRLPDQTEVQTVRGCQFRVREGMQVTAITVYLRLALFPILDPQAQ